MSRFLTHLNFELRCQLRRPTIYVATGLLFLYWLVFASRLTMDPNFWGPSGSVHCNAPVVLYFTLATQAFVTFLFVPLVMGGGPLRDVSAKVAEPWLACPMSPVAALWARFLAGFGLLSVATLIASSGIVLSPFLRVALGKLPGLELGPIPWAQLMHAWAVLVWPTLWFASCLVFWLVVLTRKSSAAIVATVVLVLGAVVSHYFGKTMHYEVLRVIDPTAFHAVHRSVSYWSLEQRNHSFLPMTQALLLNRVLWTSVGAVLAIWASMSFRVSRFLYGARAKPQRAAQHVEDAGHAGSGEVLPGLGIPNSLRAPLAWEIYWVQLKLELRQLLREPLFAAVFVLSVLWMWGQHYGLLELDFAWPQARAERLLIARRGLWMVVFYFVPFATATTVFYQKNLAGSEYLDALPVANRVQWLPKLCALALYAAAFPVIVLGTCLCTQLVYGAGFAGAGSYASVLLLSYYPFLLQFIAIAFSIALLCPSRAVAYGVTMLVLYLSIFGYETSNLQHELGLQMHESMFIWSPFDGLGVYFSKVATKSLFWLVIAAACVAISTAFWKRGWLHRRQAAKNGAWLFVALLLCAAAIALARHAIQASEAWHRSQLRPHTDTQRAEYERAWGRFRGQPGPAFGQLELSVDLAVADRAYHAKWRGKLRASTNLDPAQNLFVQTPQGSQSTVSLNGRGSPALVQDLELGVAEYPPLKWGEESGWLEVDLQHGFEGHPKKKERPLGVLSNGTYLGSKSLPHFEYDTGVEIDTTLKRVLQALPGKRASPVQSTDDDCTWRGGPRNWSVTLSTSLGQYAVAPGKLERTWVQDGRNYFRYRSEKPGCSDFAFASAAYESLDTQWEDPSGESVSIRVLHLPGFEQAAARIQRRSMEVLSWLSDVFGSYPYRNLQIVQVRDDADLGVAPANTLFLRGREGWTLRDEARQQDAELLYFIVFRLAQHWTHNDVAPADGPGSGIFSDGLPTFLAHQFLESTLDGDRIARTYITRAMRRYFWYHGAHAGEENAVLHSPGGQEHVDGYKSALALRAWAKQIGWETMRAKLGQWFQAAQAEPKPARATALVHKLALSQEAALVHEMLTDIIHYDNRMIDAQVHREEDGRYRLSMRLDAHRYRTEPGALGPTPLDWEHKLPIEVRYGPTSGVKATRMRVVVRNGSNELSWMLDHRPIEVVIDPEHLFLDISLGDQRAAVASPE